MNIIDVEVRERVGGHGIVNRIAEPKTVRIKRLSVTRNFLHSIYVAFVRIAIRPVTIYCNLEYIDGI